MDHENDESSALELRAAERYTLTPRLVGSFGAAEIQIIDFSRTGLQVQHLEPLKLGVQGRASVTVPGVGRVSWRAAVVWSHLARFAVPSGRHPYVSGMRVEEEAGDVEEVLQKLVTVGAATIDRESIERKKRALRDKAKARAARPSVKTFTLPELTTDQLLMVQHARDWLREHPDDAKKWYARAKFATTDDHAFLPQHYRDDVLAIWEFLERSIELEKIIRVYDGSLK